MTERHYHRAQDRVANVVKRSPRFRREARSLGSRVRQLREARNWTVEYGAERMQLEPRHLQKIEGGELNVTLVTLVRISHGLGEAIASLFTHQADRSSKR